MNIPKSKNPIGYTRKEIDKICKDLKINPQKVHKNIGIVTVGRDKQTGEILIYYIDLIRAIDCCINNKELTAEEWD